MSTRTLRSLIREHLLLEATNTLSASGGSLYVNGKKTQVEIDPHMFPAMKATITGAQLNSDGSATITATSAAGEGTYPFKKEKVDAMFEAIGKGEEWRDSGRLGSLVIRPA